MRITLYLTSGHVGRALAQLVRNKAQIYGLKEDDEKSIAFAEDLERSAQQREREEMQEKVEKGVSPEETLSRLQNLLAFWEEIHPVEAHLRRVLAGLEARMNEVFGQAKNTTLLGPFRPGASHASDNRKSNYPEVDSDYSFSIFD